MTFFGFYAPLTYLAFFALAIPLVLFYFLKLKRPRQAIPSLVLWQQVLKDARVNSPFQRFKRNILLLLQLLLLLLAVLALLQPYWRGSATQVDRRVILLDCSASMAALGKEDGLSRLEVAKAMVREKVFNLLPEQELCLVGFSRSARRLTGFTGNRRILLAALEKLQVEDLESDFEEATRLVDALARSTPFDEAILLSDGNFPAGVAVSPSFKLVYSPVAEAGNNLGITVLQARREDLGSWAIFVRLVAKRSAGAKVELRQGSEVIDSSHVYVEAGESERLVFRLGQEEAAVLTVRIIPDSFDALASDNQAVIELPSARALTVKVDARFTAVRNALAVHDAIRLLPVEDPATPDLMISAKFQENGAESANGGADLTLTLGTIPADLAGMVTIHEGGSRVVDWERNHPLLQHVELSDLILLDAPVFAKGIRDSDLEALGYRVIVHGENGPLLLERNQGGELGLSYHLLFSPQRSTMPYRVGFPIFVANLVRMATGRSGLAAASSVRAGTLPALRLTAKKTYHVTGPDGYERQGFSGEDGLLSGIPAPQVGRYRVSGPGGSGTEVSVSLLSQLETSLRCEKAIQFKEFAVKEAVAVTREDQPLWSSLLVAGLVVLLFEWWYFQRKPGGFVQVEK